ncbi:MAG: hypothetical protein K5753_03635 [Clostridia bacterium]|nr:hypothetical protein [Clostridia bacterium]
MAAESKERTLLRLGKWYLTEYSVFKTEEFSLATKRLSSVNETLTLLAFAALKQGLREGCFVFHGGKVSLYARLFPSFRGSRGSAVVFYKFASYPVTAAHDPRLKNLTEFYAERIPVCSFPTEKLYRVFALESDLPLPDERQRALLSIEDKNVLVQGIAGSGKTNLCIEKILFAAAESYGGKTLYTTFSRGLLLDVKKKVDSYLEALKRLVRSMEKGEVELGASESVALTALLGAPVSSLEEALPQLKRMILYLEEKVDYLLIEDAYRAAFGETEFSDERDFSAFLRDLKNYNLLNRYKKIAISEEILYKEIYGFLFGKKEGRGFSREDYAALRKGAFTKEEASFIFDLASEYREYLSSSGKIDLNLASERLAEATRIPAYSLAVIDEVQDFTEAQLAFFRKAAIKLFCVGDASQMVNPAYFSFARLKDFLYKKDVTEVKELKYNYRNSREIASVAHALSELNRSIFGSHGFILNAEAVSSEEGAFAVAFKTGSFLSLISKEKTDNFTIVVATKEEKEKLRALLPGKEILTVSEIKGLERDTVVLYNVLSVNKDRFARLARTEIDRKTADENSVYRYYFNLFYVGVSRARRHLFVAEDGEIPLFGDFMKKNFTTLTAEEAAEKIRKTVGSTLVEQEEYARRADEFKKRGQYENAFQAAAALINDAEREKTVAEIEIWRDFISRGDYAGAGLAFWEKGYIPEAKDAFDVGGEKELSDLVSAMEEGEGGEKLDYRILRFYDKLKDNRAARKVFDAVLKKDALYLKEAHESIGKALRAEKKKEKKDGRR